MMSAPSEHSDKSPRSPDSLLWPSHLPTPVHAKQRFSSTRTCFGARLGRLCAALGVASLTLMGTIYLGITIRSLPDSVHMPTPSGSGLPLLKDFSDNSEVLLTNHSASSRIQDSLSPLHSYITGWPSSGWTNDVIAAINLVYMASLTDRIPIIPPFTPSHVGSIGEAGPLEFGDVFDVPRLANELGMHILEWRDVKHSLLDVHKAEGGVQSEVEKVGCWSTWASSPFSDGMPRHSEVPALYNLDISYTPVPSSFSLSQGHKKDQYYLSIWSLASLAYQATREWAYATQSLHTLPVTSGTGERVAPAERLLCFDLLYYVGLANEEEWWKDYAPYWPKIGVHLRWAPQLLELAQVYLRRHFKVQDGEPIPPFISVHVRRADFAGWCPSNMNREACFATLETYAERVRDIQASLRAQTTPIDARAVLVTSDERDPEWWKELAELGSEWGWVDHGAEETVEKYGKWYPVVLDAVFQSLGAGFVGTDRSTMSLLAQRRVEAWNNGVGTFVRWGAPNADAR
ncbi:GDP-fucose protein O-fucosyltransferase [Rhizoctonia solani 123E]|uniref:GDP-fucose protein O-fucosyltransferase n=1 Tax=Rhizoctonia solani 123E TaxID=1423351 RepID=A0A074SXY4_9AGAM|nr:GDP-fucose protein O-fucosyltransferase [Rhizoctonia solani 123E]